MTASHTKKIPFTKKKSKKPFIRKVVEENSACPPVSFSRPAERSPLLPEANFFRRTSCEKSIEEIAC